jgi:Raf kinase inhibitor-like YbhB/YbcL family protein
VPVLPAAALLLVAPLVLAACVSNAQDKGGSMFTISSPAFESGGLIPAEYATTQVPGGANTSIPYEWRNAPAGTKSLALVLIDRAPVAGNWVHWIVYDIPASVTSLPAGASPSRVPQGARELANTFGRPGYGGPQPPPGTGKHPYEATLYALDVEQLSVATSANLEDLTKAMEGHVLDAVSITGNLGR